VRVALATLFLTLAVPAVATSAAGTHSGLRGLVTRGPVTPVCRAEAPCTAPARQVVLSFTRRGVSTETRTGDDGRYRIALPPGVYSVRVRSARFGAEPKSATVVAGRFAVRDFSIDTGIR